MEIKLLSDESLNKDWNYFIIKNSSPAVFLQAVDFSKFVFFKGQNLKFYVSSNGQLLCVASFFKVKIIGNFFYLKCPTGPVFKKELDNLTKQQIVDLLIKKIKESLKPEKIIFVRLAFKEFKHTKAVRPKILVNLKEPEQTVILNLKKTQAEILANMHTKSRYNIRLAAKKGVQVKEVDNKDLGNYAHLFYQLMQATAARDKINIFSQNYYQKLFNLKQSKDFHLKLFVANYNGQSIAAILVVGFGTTATYFYGASSNQARNLMPNHLLQWQAICWAKEQGYKFYDFWGVSEQSKNWQGITRFKKGFVGQQTIYQTANYQTNDFILNKFCYNLFKVAKLLKI